MAIPLLDLQAQHARIREQVERAVLSVLDSQRFVLGPEVDRLEARIASYCGAEHAVGVSSGTDALLCALLCEDIGEGDEVITTPFSFFASISTIVRTGARPVLCDIDPDTFCIDPEKLEPLITKRTRAILPVHLFGQTANMSAIGALAKKHGLCVIEDAAQAIGAEHAGKRAGSFGHYGCLSFFPSKNLGGAGDGGMVLCRDPERAEKLRMLRNHGQRKLRYQHELLGGNFRLDALQAAILNVKLDFLDRFTSERQENARRYRELFVASGQLVERASELSRSDQLCVPAPPADGRHVYNQFVVRVKDRERVRAALSEREIGTEVYYPVPFHAQPCLQALALGEPGSFPHSERACEQALALPIYAELPQQDLETVASTLLGLLAKNS